MRVLICGNRSFAAQGLRQRLEQDGHDVLTFNRGPVARQGSDITGPALQMADNPHLEGPFDAVVNYILLKDDGVEANVRFIDELLRFCALKKVPHLIHISSISSYASSVANITEDAPLEPVPERKGAYGALKAATDLRLAEKQPADLKLTLIRPGFILGKGLVNPIIGNAVRLPWNNLLAIGEGSRIFPLITREQVHESVARAIAQPPQRNREALLLVASNSPTMAEFLDACCTDIGCGLKLQTYPSFVWRTVAIGAEAFARLIGQAKLNPYQKLASRLQVLRFDVKKTEQRLGAPLTLEWRRVLRESMDEQASNVTIPYQPVPLPRVTSRSVTFIGFGRIVKQKHLPALTRVGFGGEVRAYDLRESIDPSGQKIQAIGSAPLAESDLFVVASPGPAHVDAIPLLRGVSGPVLVEKPLAYSPQQLAQWMEFASQRSGAVVVCHNYRFKSNVQRMMSVLASHNPGRLHHVNVHFESPPVTHDSAAWLRNERVARTLLMDYSLHFVDLACMFARQGWRCESARHELNTAGQTSLIEGRLLSPSYSVSLLLRQGFGPRRARLLFNFQNYSISLGFFPDTFAVYMANDNASLYKEEARQSSRATYRKIADKLLNKDSDVSHAALFGAVMSNDAARFASVTALELRSFYDVLFQLADRVYGT